MTVDVALTAEQQLVLQTIYDRFRADGTWQTFITVDRPLRRTRGLDGTVQVEPLSVHP